VTGFSDADLAALAGLLREAGRAEVMPRFRRLSSDAIRTKSGPLDLVTDADEAAERLITAGLQARFPGCLVVGEEAAAADPALLPRLAGAGLAFVVDPIDGTANYAAGLPLFGIMAAAIVDGAVVASCIHDPVMDESCLARAGAGAWRESYADLPVARTKLRVSPAAPIAAMTGTLAWRFLAPAQRERAIKGAEALQGVWDFRCAAHQYLLLANGRMHFSLYGRLLPWDHAPGWLLHREAGGHAARFDGSAYDPLQTTGGLICAPDAASWSALRAILL
jgi:fructose-1,6-bisphosphatase/inositol monophosphatase family enzyme